MINTTTARLALCLLGCVRFSFAQPPDRIFINGTVITMDATGTIAQAVAVRRGEVMAVGTTAFIRRLAVRPTLVTDLQGKTMLPGFYAAHDHFPSAGTLAMHLVDLNSPPIGPVQTIADLQDRLRKKLATTAAGVWVVGRGYDDTLLKEKRHPTRQDLDEVSKTFPIWIVHSSGHLGVANSRALAIAGVTKNTPQPNGGVIRKDANGEPNGVIEESLGLVSRHIPRQGPDARQKAIQWADREYLSKGVTTTVIAGTTLQGVADLKQAMSSGKLHLRVRAMLSAVPNLPASAAKASDLGVGELMRLGTVKLVQDGSIQGYTGYLGAPYFIQPEGKNDYRGYAARSREELTRIVTNYHRAGYQIAIHGNGDAAIDDILEAFRAAQIAFPRTDARHRIEHCQMAREDQLDTMLELGITPSFFVGHVFYFGDRHRDMFMGPDRAARISPLASAIKRGIKFTVHDDTPVTPVNPLQLVWGAVNRQTRNGVTLGEAQRISVIDALRAITSDAAWQNFDEKRRGSIEAGKLADFVVLDRNPLTIPASTIRDCLILETIIAGVPVYRP